MPCRVYYVLDWADCPLIAQLFYRLCFLQTGCTQVSIKLIIIFSFLARILYMNALYFLLHHIGKQSCLLMSLLMVLRLIAEFKCCGPRSHPVVCISTDNSLWDSESVLDRTVKSNRLESETWVQVFVLPVTCPVWAKFLDLSGFLRLTQFWGTDYPLCVCGCCWSWMHSLCRASAWCGRIVAVIYCHWCKQMESV